MNRHLAIVPAFNEAGAIADTITAIRSHAPDFDVVVVDDGSADRTAERARAAGAEVLRLPFNLGIGGAMQSGYLYAREQGYEVAVQVDGDGQHDPRHIHMLLQRLHGEPAVNMVTGSRFLDEDSEGFRSSAARRVGIRIFSAVVSRITGRRVTDPTSGFRMTDRRGIELFAADYPRDYPEIEAILLMHAHRLESCEVPVVMRPRLTGTSAISSTQSVYYMVKVLLAVFVGLFRATPSLLPQSAGGAVQEGDTPQGEAAGDAVTPTGAVRMEQVAPGRAAGAVDGPPVAAEPTA
ncbi:MAG: glycosyltransferase family 2 protein [Acidobacteriota bacterium]|nr:glycosyltransferase family 2 protein [Acidobacteriota bacterium]